MDCLFYFIKNLYENHFVNFKFQVPRIMWKDMKNCQRRCFNFLFEKFKEYYLPVIFPDYSISTSIYRQTTGIMYFNYLVLNPLNNVEIDNNLSFFDVSELPDCTNQNRTDINSSSRVCVIKWLAGYTQDIKQKHYYPSIPLISKFIGYAILKTI